MRAAVMYAAGEVRIDDVPDASLVEPTDALVCVTRACICGGDLWPYRTVALSETGRGMGHEFIGVVEDVGAAQGEAVRVPRAVRHECQPHRGHRAGPRLYRGTAPRRAGGRYEPIKVVIEA